MCMYLRRSYCNKILKIINLLILIFDSIYVRVCGDFWGSYLTIFTIFLHSVVKLFLCLTGDKFIAHQNAFTCEEKGVGWGEFPRIFIIFQFKYEWREYSNSARYRYCIGNWPIKMKKYFIGTPYFKYLHHLAE